MSFFEYFKVEPSSSQSIGGDIKYYDLVDWWLSEFTEDERKHIIQTYKPMGMSSGASSSSEESASRLITGVVEFSSASIVSFLSGLSGWFNNKQDRAIARKLLGKAIEYIPTTKDILDVHFLYQSIIKTYYPDRDTDPDALRIAVKACEDQIGIAPSAALAFLRQYPKQALPAHTGYEQQVILLSKEGKYQEAINLCQQALKEKWAGTWLRRIETCTKRLKVAIK